eukprot:TRINITY_DN24337_c0_g1_i1.p1 TRINITY_DN24337_c0_g1~~TRINITY_DN24337_c0_g1_i1.p1  ORF type:complete len:513 (+),score=222.44 TRINITY_DN24337_c0_g1_i1:88-1626(+)
MQFRAAVLLSAVLALCSSVGGTNVDGQHVFLDPKKNNKHLTKCDNQSDCSYERLCVEDEHFPVDGGQEGEYEKVCLHKTLFPDFSSRDIGACFCIFFGTILAASAGIGGGGLNAPIFILITGFIIQEAIPLSHATVMGNSLAQLIINFPQRHPFVEEPGKPLIDYAVPLILLPAQLGGNNLGVLLNPMIPPDILIVLAEMLLAYATFRVFVKGYQLHQAESALEQAVEDGDEEGSRASQATEASDAYGGLYHPSELKEQIGTATNYHTGEMTEDPESNKRSLEELRMQIREQDSKVPVKYVLLMAAFWALFAGGYVGLKENDKCSTWYWLILAAMYPVMIAFTIKGAYWVKEEALQRDRAHMPPIEGSVEWTSKMLLTAPLAAGGVGCVAGLLGLGGGELMAPLLLELGMLPKAASATSAYMIIWTTSSNIIHYSVGNDLPWGYAGFFSALGFSGGLVGRYLAIRFVAKYNKQSLIAFALGVVLTISMILFAYRAATSSQADPWWPFAGPCD